MISNSFFKRLSICGWVLCGLVSISFLFAGHWKSSLGVTTGFFWIFLNTYFLFQLVQMSFTPQAKPKDKIFVLSILKFPVLYLIGFFILKSRFFPVHSILTGLSIFLAVFLIAWIRFNARSPKVVLILLFFLGVWAGSVFAQSESDEEGAHHLVNLVGLTADLLGDTPVSKALRDNENIIFGLVVIVILSAIFHAASRRLLLIPGRFQAACEAIIQGLYDFVCGILGPENGRKHTPFLGSLFLYIWTMNLIGLIPLIKSNTANSMTLQGPVPLPIPTTTVALALVVFVYVQAIGIKNLGLLGYLDHMAGNPRDVVGWIIFPIMFPLHLIGELVKPLSLTFRLFGNMMGGHVLVAVFVGMAIGAYFIPLQAPFLLFEILTSTIQAFVFTLLSTVYIAMMLPHDHSHEYENEPLGRGSSSPLT